MLMGGKSFFKEMGRQGYSSMTKSFNGIKSTMKSDMGVARSMGAGAMSAYRTGGFAGAGADLYNRGSRAWANSSKADKMRYAGYGAGATGMAAWGLSD